MTVYTNINQTHINSTKASEINSFGLLQYFFILNALCAFPSSISITIICKIDLQEFGTSKCPPIPVVAF